MKSLLPLLYPVSLVGAGVVSITLDFSLIPEIAIAMALIIFLLCLLPLGLLLSKRRWRQSIVTVAVAFLLVVLFVLMVLIFSTNLVQNTQYGGGFGVAIGMSLGIFNKFIVSSLLFVYLSLLVLTIFKGLQKHFSVLKHPLFLNALIGVTILVWASVYLITQSSGPFGGDTLETIPTAAPVFFDSSQ